jgi:hypothetical protein
MSRLSRLSCTANLHGSRGQNHNRRACGDSHDRARPRAMSPAHRAAVARANCAASTLRRLADRIGAGDEHEVPIMNWRGIDWRFTTAIMIATVLLALLLLYM